MFFFKRNIWIIPKIEFKKYIPGICIFYIVICKFRYMQKFYLVILLPIDTYLKINFHYVILPLDLVICLQIEGGRRVFS